MKELAYLNKYLLKYKYYLMGGLLLVLLNNIFGVLVAPLTREALLVLKQYYPLYGNSLNPEHKEILFDGFMKELLTICGAIIGSSIIAGIFLYYQRKILIGMSRHIEYDLKNEIYHHYQTLPLSFYRRNNTGDLMNRISEDVSQVRQYLGPCIMYGLNMIAIFAVTIPFMLSVNTKLTIFTLIPLPLLALSIYLVNSRVTRLSEAIQKNQSDLSTFVQESFSGIRILKSFVREKESINRFAQKSDEYRESSIRLSSVQAFFFPMILTLIGASNILVVYIGGLETIKENIEYANIAEFLIYLNKLSWPVASLGWISSLVQRAEVSQRRINEFLNARNELHTGDTKLNIHGEIEFKNVSFTYPDTGVEALRDISFIIRPGETIAIVGNTGSGKSTIANLICRMYDPSKGSVLIDGKNLRDIDAQHYRSQLGYVPQDIFLFSDNIRNNIAFGSDQTEEASILQAAKDADLYHNILDFPQGFDTVIGERGITLSGGQKQRLSIARAIVRNPKILVLDDCLSAVDTRTEHAILENMERIMHNRTSVIISHRVSSVKLAAKILVLSEGNIAEHGSHEELMKKGGLYREMYQKQLEEEK